MPVHTEAATLGDVALSELRQHFQFREPGAVGNYLAEHPETLSVLTAALPKIRSIFSEDTPLILDVPPDYEGEDERDLYVRIQTQLPVDAAVERMDRFNEIWWRRASANAPIRFTLRPNTSNGLRLAAISRPSN